MSDTPPTGDPPQDPPAPETPPDPPAAATVTETPPPAPPPAPQDDLASVAAEFRAVVGDLRGALDGLRQPSSPSTGAPAVVTPAPPPTPRKDPRSWLQRAWFGPRRF